MKHKTLKWTTLLLALVLASSLLLAGCGPKEPGGKDAEGKNVAMITDIGGINDESFNQ